MASSVSALPRPLTARAPLAWLGHRFNAWRDALKQDLQLAAAIAGGLWLMYSLGAWSTLGSLSRDFGLFSGTVFLHWFWTIVAELLSLRWLRGRGRAGGAWMFLRFALVVMLAMPVAMSPLGASPYAERLGLMPQTPSGLKPHVLWMLICISAFLVFRDEGLRRQALAFQRLQQLQAAQIASRRRVVESQLRALQARVDPQLFFNLLDAIQRHYVSDAARAEALLDELIVFLRAALPRLHSTSSCLAQELALVQSYVRAQALANDAAATLSIDISPEVQELGFPPGVLLPTLAGIARACPAGARLELAASVSPTSVPRRKLVLTLNSPVAMPAPMADGLRQTLLSLYSDAATLTCTPTGGGRFHHCLSVPLETL